ncbi:hypothetical protein [Plastoroseomonas arctica]|uniref:Lipoprotein n=1 Tax=Plastoroseomonas arctica TaxID=1509237 RepID=A0AAF1JUF0_9PROT|nr:hypothetical protein [Plastoroseomonas arctica]MBR0653631.1 hypothetical protein [Plastoroseomonas arctica]
MVTRIAAAALLALGLAGCGTVPPSATLYGQQESFGEPTRTAILNTAFAFSSPANLNQQPADAALAVAQAEHLAVELAYGTRWRQFSPLVPAAFETARPEWRAALGIVPNAPPQQVINAMFQARRALQQDNLVDARTALSGPIFTQGGQATLARLAALPPLPQTNYATSSAEGELIRRDGGRRGR